MSQGASRLENGNVPRCSLALTDVMLHECLFEQCCLWLPISGRVDRAYATEAVDSGSIPGRVKPKTIKIGIHSFPS